MNTPLMELIEWIKSLDNPAEFEKVMFIERDVLTNKISELIEKEKTMILTVFFDGTNNGLSIHNSIMPQEYYDLKFSKTFTNESK